jgi:hypothetical protein
MQAGVDKSKPLAYTVNPNCQKDDFGLEKSPFERISHVVPFLVLCRRDGGYLAQIFM